MQTIQVSPAQLTIDKFNPRSVHDEKRLKALESSVRANGILQPLLARPTLPQGVEPLNPAQMKFTVVSGGRRLEVSKRIGLESVPVTVREMTDAEAAEIGLVEQENHEPFTAMEIAEHIEKWMALGTPPDEIGTKLERKKAWVYSTKQLVHLIPEARKALASERINDTMARELATVPPSAQGTVLRRLLEPGVAGQLTSREASEIVASYRQDLTKAPFDPRDVTLECVELNGAGACDTCPMRSGARPGLFEGTANQNLCTSPLGFASRSDNAWARRMDDGDHNRGPKCLSPKQTDRYFDPAGNLRDDAPFVAASATCYSDTASRPYSALLGPNPQRHYLLARSPKGAVVEVLRREKLDEYLEEGAKIRRAPSAVPKQTEDDDAPKLSAEERKRNEEKRRRRAEAKVRIIGAIVATVAKRGFDKKTMRFLADCCFNQGAVSEEMQARRDIKESPAKYLERLSEGELGAFVYEATASFNLYGHPGAEKYPDAMKDEAARWGVDIKEHEREVMALEKAAPTKKPAKSKGGAK